MMISLIQQFNFRSVLGGSSQDLQLANNYGPWLTSPLSGVVPLPNGHSWLINGGDPRVLSAWYSQSRLEHEGQVQRSQDG